MAEHKQGLPFGAEGTILPVPLEGQMRSAYLDYSMSVIVGRALPDARDGLKPVQLRILYAMREMALWPDKKHMKSAAVAGEVMGKYHPHGDAAIYDAMVRLAQDFSMRYPLVDGHGNFGSLDGDPPAAARYTEARLSKIAVEMLADIEKETVDFRPNYDGRLEEPVWLPTKVPNLLMNGSIGLAVGMATAVPPHNLTELCHALLHLLDNPKATTLDLVKFVPGPDFPTGGIIIGRDIARAIYTVGRGNIRLRGKVTIEEDKKRPRIVVTEIPYMVHKSDIITRIAELVRDKRLDGIYDIRDETDRKGIRVVVELDGDRAPEYVLHQLYRLTPLESTVNVGFLALVEGIPRLLTLLEMLQIFLDHRKSVITRRTQFDLRKAREREHILFGLSTALQHIDEVIAIIKKSESPDVARERLSAKFKLTEIQTRAILDMRLQTLTGLEISRIREELELIKKTIADLEDILARPERLRSVIRHELKEVQQKFGDERRTTFEEPQDVELHQLIHKEQVVVTITRKGYIKRVPLDAYRTYNKGAKGLIGLELTGEDAVHDMAVGWTTEPLFLFTKSGKIYSINTYEIFDADRYGRGRPITNLLDDVSGEQVAFIKAPDEARKTVILITRAGKAKRIHAEELLSIRRNGKIVAKMREGDELLEAFWVDETDRIFIVTRKGRGILFSVSQIRAMGRGAKGVRAIRLNPGDGVAGATVVRGKQEILFLTEKGYAKRLSAEDLRTYEHRGGKGVIVYRIKDLTGEMIGVRTIENQEEVASLTTSGKVVRQKVEGISEQSRYARGVRAVTLDEGDKIETFDLL